MPGTNDIELLQRYAREGSEEAFAALVTRYVNLVYSAALRKTGNPHAAEEITQAVFIILARKAGHLRERTILSGWLYQTARLTAAGFLRTELRRARREQEAYMETSSDETESNEWSQVAPLLEDAMGKLGDDDRAAVVLRFFEKKSFQEVAAAFGTSENAAKKRVGRALEKLRKVLAKRGVVSTSAIIANGISSRSIQTAPMALAKSVTAVALSKGAATSASTLTLIKGALKLMAWTKAKTATVVGVTLILATGTATVTFPKIRHSYLERKVVWNLDSQELQKQPAVVLIRPTQSIPGMGGGYITTGGKMIGLKNSVLTMLTLAYRDPTSADGIHADRVVVAANLPGGEYDFIVSTPQNQGESLQQALKKEFGLVARRETRDMDVLLLQVKNPEVAAGLKLSETEGGSSQDYQGKHSIRGGSLSLVADFIEDSLLQIPVIDRTGLTNVYDIDLTWNVKGRDWTYPKRPVLDHILSDQLGLELVPSREPIEMLVVEKAK